MQTTIRDTTRAIPKVISMNGAPWSKDRQRFIRRSSKIELFRRRRWLANTTRSWRRRCDLSRTNRRWSDKIDLVNEIICYVKLPKRVFMISTSLKAIANNNVFSEKPLNKLSIKRVQCAIMTSAMHWWPMPSWSSKITGERSKCITNSRWSKRGSVRFCEMKTSN